MVPVWKGLPFFRLEMFKFSVYILFPMGTLFLYHQQDWLSLSKQTSAYEEFKPDPSKLYVCCSVECIEVSL
jgi:hypothetical protein